MAAAMNGLDALVFTGGIGEHAPPVRSAAAAGLAFLGVGIDEDANAAAAGQDGTAAATSARRVPGPYARAGGREDLEIARAVRALLGTARPVPARRANSSIARTTPPGSREAARGRC